MKGEENWLVYRVDVKGRGNYHDILRAGRKMWLTWFEGLPPALSGIDSLLSMTLIVYEVQRKRSSKPKHAIRS